MPSSSGTRDESRVVGPEASSTDPALPFMTSPQAPQARSTTFPTNTQNEPDTPSNNESENTMVSTVFLPNIQISSLLPDIVLLSSDSVEFHVHSPILTSSGMNLFLGISPQDHQNPSNIPTISVDDTSNVMNIILHAGYGISCAHFNHTLSDITTAVDRLPSYGIKPKDLITSSHPLHNQIMSFVPLQPLQVYTLAARHDLEIIAVPCSAHLLSLPLHSLSNEVTESIGAVYLKRLYHLHNDRQQTLANLLLRPFQLQHAGPQCDLGKQQEVGRAWTLAAAHFVLEARTADVSNENIESTFRPIMPLITCGMCRKAVEDKIKEMTIEWSMCKNTI